MNKNTKKKQVNNNNYKFFVTFIIYKAIHFLVRP